MRLKKAGLDTAIKVCLHSVHRFHSELISATSLVNTYWFLIFEKIKYSPGIHWYYTEDNMILFSKGRGGVNGFLPLICLQYENISFKQNCIIFLGVIFWLGVEGIHFQSLLECPDSSILRENTTSRPQAEMESGCLVTCW